MARKHVAAVAIATASAGISSQPAHAQEPADSWTGPYVGVLVGGNRTRADGSYKGYYYPPIEPGPTPTPIG